MTTRFHLALRALVCGALLATLPAQAQPATQSNAGPNAGSHTGSDTDYFKQAGNFLQNCDARKDETGQRPEENYLCLSFMAGLIEGYTYAAVANGNARPYCLPRPVSLVEMMDMMAAAIERGAPPDLPSAAVFHFILTETFPCGGQEAGGAPAPTPAR